MKIEMHFVHAAPTPHNNYLLDNLSAHKEIKLWRHYIFGPDEVPERQWSTMKGGKGGTIRAGVSKYFDFGLIKKAIFSHDAVFFIVGWEYPLLAILIFIRSVMKSPLIMWDDGHTESAIQNIAKNTPKQFIKRFLVRRINASRGTYFHTGRKARESLVSMGFDEEKFENLPFFVEKIQPPEDFRNSVGIDKNVTQILAGGRLIYRKGYDVFVEALHLLSQKTTVEWHATLIGSGEDGGKISDLVKTFDLGRHVTQVDWAEPNTFQYYVATSDIFVAPARFDHFPTTILTAMQYMSCIVSTDKVGSAVEFIESGRQGIIVSSDSAEEMCLALYKLLENPASRAEMAENAKSSIDEWPVSRGVDLIVNAAEEASIRV